MSPSPIASREAALRIALAGAGAGPSAARSHDDRSHASERFGQPAFFSA